MDAWDDNRVFQENFGWVGFVVVFSLRKVNPNRPKIICCGKKVAQMPLFGLTFLGLGWPWVGEFVGFIKIFYVFQPNRIWEIAKHRNPTRPKQIPGKQIRIPISFRWSVVMPFHFSAG